MDSKNSLAMAYSLKKRAKKMAAGEECVGSECEGCPSPQCLAEGGSVDSWSKREDNEKGINKITARSGVSQAGAALKPAFSMAEDFDKDAAKRKHVKTLAEMKAMKDQDRQNMAEGGIMEEEKSSGYMDHEGNDRKHNGAAMAEDDLDLNQKMVHPEDSSLYGEVDHEMKLDQNDESQDARLGGDLVDRIMKKRQMYSEGGKIANGGDDDLDKMADGRPNNFDDLALRDDLESSYGEDNNAGDANGDAQEDEDRADIVARIMRQRSMKQRNPVPA